MVVSVRPSGQGRPEMHRGASCCILCWQLMGRHSGTAPFIRRLRRWWLPETTPPRFLLYFVGMGVFVFAGALWAIFSGLPAARNAGLATCIVVLSAAALGITFAVALPDTDRRLRHVRGLRAAAKIMSAFLVICSVTLAAVMIPLIYVDGGLTLLGRIEIQPFTSDAIAMTHQANEMVLDGENPYGQTNVITAMQNFTTVSPTLLRQGAFADAYPGPTGEADRRGPGGSAGQPGRGGPGVRVHPVLPRRVVPAAAPHGRDGPSAAVVLPAVRVSDRCRRHLEGAGAPAPGGGHRQCRHPAGLELSHRRRRGCPVPAVHSAGLDAAEEAVAGRRPHRGRLHLQADGLVLPPVLRGAPAARGGVAPGRTVSGRGGRWSSSRSTRRSSRPTPAPGSPACWHR